VQGAIDTLTEAARSYKKAKPQPAVFLQQAALDQSNLLKAQQALEKALKR
jgi:HEPN domain-containing protein